MKIDAEMMNAIDGFITSIQNSTKDVENGIWPYS